MQNLTERNRALPTIGIALAPDSASSAKNEVAVSVSIRDEEYALPDGRRSRSGAGDLKIFRNGVLVDFVPGDLLKGNQEAQLTRTVSVPLSSKPQTVEISAYLFNNDGVKSLTVSERLTLPPSAVAPGPPRAYVLAIGVNETRSANLHLDYAVNDALLFAKDVGERLANSGFGSPQLVNTTIAGVTSNVVLANRENPSGASKVTVRESFASLSKLARPTDTVFVMFAGHGFTGDDGKYYLVPSDIDDRSAEATKRSSISSDELAEWFRTLDAGEIVFVLDSCQSASTVESDGFKPGPMTSAGLGQLAYDKRMRILAASQTDGAALEFGQLKHGLLTYALLVEGLEFGAADWQPRDGTITIGEWLRFGEQRVPVITEKIQRGETIGDPATSLDLMGRWVPVPQTKRSAGKFAQRPRLFDFRRSSAEDGVLAKVHHLGN
jgi:hypothetical protein